MKKIIRIFKKAYNKLLRKKTSRANREQEFGEAISEHQWKECNSGRSEGIIY